MVTQSHSVGEGMADLGNGDLIERAEKEGYQVLITTDQNIRYQQNRIGRRSALVVLLSIAWPDNQLELKEIRTVLTEVRPGELREVPI